MKTTFRRRSTGQTVTFRLKPDFVRRFLDLPRGELATAGEAVLKLRDDDIFSIEKR
jgi:hypothetical protein